jgi:hypothetical protein
MHGYVSRCVGHLIVFRMQYQLDKSFAALYAIQSRVIRDPVPYSRDSFAVSVSAWSRRIQISTIPSVREPGISIRTLPNTRPVGSMATLIFH